MRDWPQVYRSQLAILLKGDPGFDHVWREDIPDKQPIVIFLKSIEHLTKRARSALDLRGFFGLEFIEIPYQWDYRDRSYCEFHPHRPSVGPRNTGLADGSGQ